MEACALLLALVSLVSASIFEMNEYLEKLNIQTHRWRRQTDLEHEDSLMYLCCDTDDPNESPKEAQRARKIQEECCEEMISKIYAGDQQRMTPERRHKQYVNETACFMLCGFRKLEAADSEGNVKDGMVETLANSLGITSNSVIQEAEQICYNRTIGMKDQLPGLMCNSAPYMFLKCIRELNNLHCQKERKFRGAICDAYMQKLNQTYHN